MHRTFHRALPIAVLAVLAGAPSAVAQDDPATTAAVTGGQTMLQLDSGTARALTGAGVRVSPVGQARNTASGLTFPVRGGEADPGTLAGTVTHRGGIRFRAGGRSVVLRDPTYRIGERSTLSARVGSARLTIANLDAGGARIAAGGALDTGVSGVTATLTAGAARALNATFSTRLFRAGLKLGTVRSEVRFGEVVFAGGATGLALDPGAAAALTSLGVTPGAIAPAFADHGELRFPITGGAVNARTLAGTIAHSGGLSLTAGATSVALRDFVIGIDDTPALSALLGDDRVEILTLDASGARTSVQGANVTVSGVVARLTAGAATALNGAFGVTAFTEGLTLGTATVRGVAR